MICFLWCLLFAAVVLIFLYNQASVIVFTMGVAVFLLFLDVFSSLSVHGMVILWVLWACLLPFCIRPIRRILFSRKVLTLYRRAMPVLSKTEREALEAGSVWWDAELFSGKPNWQKLMSFPNKKLTAEEEAFIEGPVKTLCGMLNDWEITHELGDLPESVWCYIREQGFFGLIIPKSYGGKEFSALAHVHILVKLFSCSVTAASTVGVPNSLGPAELLLHYGTKEQKDYYLPRLAAGKEVPCFALTSLHAGSDAAAITDKGIVCRKVVDGKEVIGINLTWSKRYITLAPIATVLGLAFKMYDPEHLLGDKEDIGITCALIPTNTPGVIKGRRHYPSAVFQNGPTQGENVFVPLDYIIGGVEMAGQGWRMLMECLSAGRSITLPSSGVAGGLLASVTSGAYARIRRQFNVAIGQFEGIQEVLARIIGYAYQADAATSLTAQAIDQGEKPAVLSGIVKYHCTEIGRLTAIDAMDIHGGKAICMGPKNYLALGYHSVPISITVEGANILTRNLIIFGQGSIRCHPYVLAELHAAKLKDDKQALLNFDKSFFGHIGFCLSNFFRAGLLSITNARCALVPRSSVKRYLQQITRFSASFAFLADVTMIILGASLKRKERLSARLGDILSYLYLASATIKHYANSGYPSEDYPIIQWVCEDLFYKTQLAFKEIFANYPNRIVACCLSALMFPMGYQFKKPSDRLEYKVANLVLQPSNFSHYAANRIHSSEGYNGVHLLQQTLHAAIELEPIEKKIRQAVKAKQIVGYDQQEKVYAALKVGIITEEEFSVWTRGNKLREEVLSVDDFAFGDIGRGKAG